MTTAPGGLRHPLVRRSWTRRGEEVAMSVCIRVPPRTGRPCLARAIPAYAAPTRLGLHPSRCRGGGLLPAFGGFGPRLGRSGRPQSWGPLSRRSAGRKWGTCPQIRQQAWAVPTWPGSLRAMETYTSSPSSPEAYPARAPTGPGLPAALDWLDAAVANLATLDPGQEPDAARLRLLAAVDARGAAGAEHGTLAPTAGWLRANRRLSPHAAAQWVRTARALHRGPLAGTARALAAGEVSYAHAAVLADATSDLPPARVAEAEPVFLDAAARLDPPRLRRVAEHLRELVDPDQAEERGRARLEKRGLWLSVTFDGLVDVKGLLDPEAGEAAVAALAPLARPACPDDERSAPQRRADAFGELARWRLQAGDLPQEGGLRPQVNVTADLATLQAPHGVGGTGLGVGSCPARRSGGLP